MISTLQTRKNQRKLLYWNSLVWSIGNSLTSSTLANCMLYEMGFRSQYLIAFIYAVPFLCRLLLTLLPYTLERISSRKKLCIGLYGIQTLMLLFLVAFYWFMPVSNEVKVFFILLFWGIAGLAEGMAYAVFLSWCRQLFPGKTLGRFYARREGWKLIGEMIPFLLLIIINCGIYFSLGNLPQRFMKILIYSGLMFLGAAIIFANTFWLARLPDVRFQLPCSSKKEPEKKFWTEFQRVLKPFSKKEFWPFLIYSALFSFFMQIEQVPQFKFQAQILDWGILGSYIGVSSLRFVTRAPQIFLMSWIGKLVDRLGTVNIMIISQILTAFPLIFYTAASVNRYWPFLYIGAVIWISYAGLNGALPKLQMDFSDPSDDTPWLAAYGLAGSVAGVLGVFIGARIHISFQEHPNFYFWFFFIAFIWRILIALPLICAKWRSKSLIK